MATLSQQVDAAGRAREAALTGLSEKVMTVGQQVGPRPRTSSSRPSGSPRPSPARRSRAGPLLAGALGDVDVQYVWRFLRNHKIDLVVRKSWCESNDPNFTAKAADVVGLYGRSAQQGHCAVRGRKALDPALERAQGYLKSPNGRALTGQSHDYKRHGTTTLFAALEVATGKIIATHSNRRRRVEFLDFMNSLTAAFPNRKLHVILDNLSTHKKNEHWLKAHPNVQFHFTPTSASWLNQVEVWFSILQGQSLSGASFTNLKQLQEHIDAYVNAYNDRAQPFVSTKKKVLNANLKAAVSLSSIPGTRIAGTNQQAGRRRCCATRPAHCLPKRPVQIA